MTTAFTYLTFQPHPNHPGGVRARVFYPNGYGASVIQSRYSYGGDKGLYELAVLRGTANDCDLCYTTPITDDVEGYLSPEAVSALLVRIAALPAD
jgi:hypothetical protein